MITKKPLKSKPVTKLTFELPKDFGDSVDLLADFTGWEPVSMAQLKNGKWKHSQDVESGKAYEFIYRAQRGDDVAWEADADADGSVPSPYGSVNGVVHC